MKLMLEKDARDKAKEFVKPAPQLSGGNPTMKSAYPSFDQHPLPS